MNKQFEVGDYVATLDGFEKIHMENGSISKPKFLDRYPTEK